MITNPALLASLFVVAVSRVEVPAVAAHEATADQPASQGVPASEYVSVKLSDGSEHRFAGFVETPNGEVTELRVGLRSDDHNDIVVGPIVTEAHRALFESAKVELPDLTPPAPEPPAGPTDEEIAAHRELVQKGIDEAAAAAAAALASSHPEIATAIEVADALSPALIGLVEKVPTQQHYDRLHSLMDVAARELPSAFSWVVREMRVIHTDLRPRTTE